ncbi:MAG: response regulator [Lachnospiraceae bacterium]|nr:response regulator [Lachnospiraceae bacterium]
MHDPKNFGEFCKCHPNVAKSIRLFIFLVFLSATTALLFLQNNGFISGTISTGELDFSYLNMPMIVLSAIGGFVPSIMSFFSLFIIEIFTRSDVAYSSFAYLMTICTAYVLARKGWFRKLSTSILSIPIFSVFLGIIWFVINELLNARGLGNINATSALAFVTQELPEACLGAMVSRLWYRFMPEHIINICRFGDYDSLRLKFLEEIKYAKEKKRGWISAKITGIIVIEATILAVSAAVFAVLLINDMGKELLPPSDSEGIEITVPDSSGMVFETDEETGETKPKFAPIRREHINVTNNSVAFALRLIMMLMNMAVPIAVLTDAFAQLTIAKPINRMASSMKNFCEASNEEKNNMLESVQNLDIHTHDEIEDLYGYMNRMVNSVMEFEEHLKEEQKLQEDLRVAEKASQAKSDFLSSMSHEIRTPINAVLGLDEMILREAEDDTILSYAMDIQTAGHSLLSLVNDILDFSKIEAGKMEIIPVDYELSSTVNDLVNMIAIRAEAKKLSLLVEVNPEIPHLLFGDEVRIKQVVTNILTNAVKYTETGTVTLKVDYEKTDDENIGLSFLVKDTGIGMKEEDLKKLYSPFERIEEERNRTIEGTGLGMSIVKQLLDKMGSELKVSSVYGEGSEFSFVVTQQVKKWEPIGDYAAMYKETLKNRNRNKYKESFRAPDANILITDDTRMNLTVVVALLKKTGIKIDTAMSGKETLAKVKEKHYDVIFLDHMMPEMDGIETLQNMLSMKDNMSAGVPVIALTANAVSGSREKYLEAGFTDYLTKPVDGERIEKMLVEYLPKEKVFLTEEKDQETAGEETEVEEASNDENETIIRSLSGIDADELLKNSGSFDVGMEVIKEYYENIDGKSKKIEEYFAAEDYKNYKVLVHALKSSSRLIGATELSEKAKLLEEAANNEDVSYIKENTGELLTLYRSYEEKLAPVVGDDTSDENKPEIPEDEFLNAMQTIKELVEAFDFDSADDVIDMLKEYKIPESRMEMFRSVREGVSEVDREKLLEILK